MTIDRERLRWIDDFVTPVAIMTAVEGLLSVSFDVREAFFGGGGVLHTIGFWFVVAIVCIERYALTVVEPIRRGMYQLLLWAAVLTSCVRFEMLLGEGPFVASLLTSLAVLTGVGVFAQRLTAAMNRSLVKKQVGLDVMDAIYGRVRDRTSGVVVERVDGVLVERVDTEAVEAEERARATDDTRARRSLLTWLVAGTAWLAVASALVELGDPGARRAVLVHGARFAVATPLLLAIASMRSRRERVVERGGRAPAALVHRRFASAVAVLAVAAALGAVASPLVVGSPRTDGSSSSADAPRRSGSPSASSGETVVAAAKQCSSVSRPDASAVDASSEQGASGHDAGQREPSTGQREPSERDSTRDGRGRGTQARPDAAFGGCGFAASGALAIARLVLAIALLVTLYRWLTGRRRVRVRARRDGPVADPRRSVDAWLAEVGRAPLDEVPATAWSAIRDSARVRGLAGADELAPRELVHALTADRPPWEPELRALAKRYERTVFGGGSVDASARSEWLAALSRLLPAIRATGTVRSLDKRDGAA